MSAMGVEEITHDTDALLRPSKQVQVKQQIDKSLEGACPHFLRFAFGHHDITCTPSATYMESAQPIPCVPLGNYKYSNITSTIATHPHLFQIVTPIHINWFEELLGCHPNHLLVESVCHGLCEGFWPFANMENPVLQPLGTVDRCSGLPNLNDESLTFLQHQRDQEMASGRYSKS